MAATSSEEGQVFGCHNVEEWDQHFKKGVETKKLVWILPLKKFGDFCFVELIYLLFLFCVFCSKFDFGKGIVVCFDLFFALV